MKIDVGTSWCGGDDDALALVADKARELGAHAVMNVAAWHQPSGFAWSAPHASGFGIVFVNRVPLDPNGGRAFWDENRARA